MSEVEQWVNLPKEDVLVKGDIKFKSRLGDVEFRVTFAKSALGFVKVRLLPHGANVDYEANEKTRNGRFDTAERYAVTKPPGSSKFEPDILTQLPAAGANKYQLEAKDAHGKVVKSSRIVVARRRLYYQIFVLPRAGSATAPTRAIDVATQVEASFWGNDVSLKLECAGSKLHSGSTQNSDSIQCDAYRDFLDMVAKKVKFDVKAVSFTIASIPQIATKKQTTVELKARASADPTKAFFVVEAQKRLYFNSPSYLWHGFDATEDAANAWLVDVELKFETAPGLYEKLVLNRSDARVEPPKLGFGGHKRFSVDLARVWSAYERRKGLTAVGRAKLNVVGSFANGSSYPGKAFIALAQCAFWKERDAAEMKRTLEHEVGHLVGLAASGDVRAEYPFTPNSVPANYYDQFKLVGTTHKGRHCKKGASWDASKKKWTRPGTCLMFGSSDGGTAFCPDCLKAARKVDVSTVRR